MFSGGMGQLEDCHIEKGLPEEGTCNLKTSPNWYCIEFTTGVLALLLPFLEHIHLDFAPVTGFSSINPLLTQKNIYIHTYVPIQFIKANF